MKKILTLTTITILTFGFIGQAADDADFRFKVDVKISCDDENIKSTIESYIKRELRALRDVDIVTKFGKTGVDNEDAVYFLEIVVVGDRITGYSIAYCFYSRVAHPPRLDHIHGLTEVKDYLEGVKLLAVIPPTLGVMRGPAETLKEACEHIVVNFDTKLLDFTRTMRRR